MIEKDAIQRFYFKDAQIRGEIIRLDKAYTAIVDRHPYPIAVQQFLGQALAASALLSAIIKFQGKMTLQIQAEGPITLLVTQSDEKFHIRGLAKWKNEKLIADKFSQAFGKGHLAISIAATKGEHYQGIVNLSEESLAASLENYFHQSEQLPTCLCLFADKAIAGGILLQLMPADTAEERYSLWEELIYLTRTLTAEEFLYTPNQTIFKRLYHSEDIQLFNPEPVVFHCDCSVEKMERALIMLGEKEVTDILQQHKVVTVTCEFCNYHYDFDRAAVARIFASGPAPEQKR